MTKLLISLTLVSNNIFGWLFSDKFLNYNINFYFFLHRYILILWLNYIIFHGYFEPGEENELELEEVLTTQLIYFSDDACLHKVPHLPLACFLFVCFLFPFSCFICFIYSKKHGLNFLPGFRGTTVFLSMLIDIFVCLLSRLLNKYLFSIPLPTPLSMIIIATSSRIFLEFIYTNKILPRLFQKGLNCHTFSKAVISCLICFQLLLLSCLFF